MVFVTGGTGLIGSFLLRALRGRGLAVRALHRGAAPTDAATGVEWLAGDLLDTELLRTAITAEVTHVFHFAGPVSYTPPRAHETVLALGCRLRPEKKKQTG